LVASVRAAARGSRSRGKAFLTVPWASLRRAEHENGKRELSERELEVLLLAARGLSNRQIAYHLQLSEATVKRHLANLYPKMGVHSRSEATRKAFTEGWFTIQDLALDA
jgi:DNA-binding NarL/FixJ family response regulator